MNRLFILIIVAFSCNFNYTQCLLNYGLKAGFNISNQNRNYSYKYLKMDWNNFPGVNIKGFVSYPVIYFLELEGEFGYSKKGVQTDIPYSSIENPVAMVSILILKRNLIILPLLC